MPWRRCRRRPRPVPSTRAGRLRAGCGLARRQLLWWRQCARPRRAASLETPTSCLKEHASPAARAALEELADAGVLSRKSVARGTTEYIAKDVLDLLI
jgi:hypothetical protein